MKKINFGLIGKDISYSFSRKYFGKKFNELQLDDHEYHNFDLQTMNQFPTIIGDRIDSIHGLNVTIPYKLEIFKYLDEIDQEAKAIGAVNTIKVMSQGKLKGFNTDIYGFEASLKPLLANHMESALILGTGGASKAIAFALGKLGISYKYVSRNPINNQSISYEQLNKEIVSDHHLIINCTPLGTFPNVEICPNIPYHYLSNKHLLYDLIYNPPESLFLSKGAEMGASTKNGLQMLELQADKSWEIWRS